MFLLTIINKHNMILYFAKTHFFHRYWIPVHRVISQCLQNPYCMCPTLQGTTVENVMTVSRIVFLGQVFADGTNAEYAMLRKIKKNFFWVKLMCVL